MLPNSLFQAHAEALVLEANRAAPNPNLLTASIRPASIFGEGDIQLVAGLVDVYYAGQSKFQIGSNENLFDFTYAGNIAYAHILAALALIQTGKLATAPLDYEKVDGEAFMITNDSPIYFWDFARVVWKELGETRGTEHVWTISKEVGMPLGSLLEVVGKITRRPSKLTQRGVRFSCMTRYYNINKAKTRLGYKPLISMQEGIARSVKSNLALKAEAAAKKGQ